MSTRSFVTGGTGFVGSHLAEALAARGDAVVALVRRPSRAGALGAAGVRIVEGGLDDESALARACAGSAVVYHVAGLVRARNEAEFLRANRDGTARVVAAAHAAGVARFVYVSSMAAGGPSVPGTPRYGDEPSRPVTAYGRSKLAGEDVVRSSGLGWTIVRPPLVYGPRDTEFLPLFRLARRGIAPLFGDGRQELSGVFAPDLAQALVAAASAGTTIGRTYYACHSRTFTSRELVRAVGCAVGRDVRVVCLPPLATRAIVALSGFVARISGKTVVLAGDKAHELLAPAWTGDPRPLARDTGWLAQHDLAPGLSRTADWYRREDLL